MGVYIFLLIGTVLVGIPLCSEKCGRSGRLIYCCAAAAVFMFISAVRYQVGYDFSLYGGTYYNIAFMYPDEISQLKMEKGFLMPLYVLGIEFESYYTVFIYTSLIIYSAVFFLIYKNSSCPWISVTAYLCMGLFFNSLCFIRQVIAALIVTYALKYADRKFSARFFVMILAASLFHWSALIMIPLFWLLQIKPGYIYLGVIAGLTVIFCIFSRTFITWAADTFYMYNVYDISTNREVIVGLSPKFTIMFGLAFALCFIFRERLMEINPKNKVYINCAMYMVVFEATGMRHAVLSRFAIIVCIAPIIFMAPDVVQAVKEFFEDKFFKKDRALGKKYGIAAMSALSLYCAGFYFMLLIGNYNGVVPYASRINRPEEVYSLDIADSFNNGYPDDGEDWDEDEWDYENWDDEGWDDEGWDDENWDSEGQDGGSSGGNGGSSSQGGGNGGGSGSGNSVGGNNSGGSSGNGGNGGGDAGGNNGGGNSAGGADSMGQNGGSSGGSGGSSSQGGGNGGSVEPYVVTAGPNGKIEIDGDTIREILNR